MAVPARKQRIITSDKIDQTRPASIVINRRFRGLADFCQIMGYPTSTVYEWLLNGYIPSRYAGQPTCAEIIRRGAERGYLISPADFIDAPDGQ